MKHDELDRMFDESMNRPMTNGYSASPLAADHVLLKRSWEYFRHRIRMLEDHWKKILESKDIEITALTKEINLIKEREGALQAQNEAFRSFEEEYSRSKATDYLMFEKKIRQMRESWEDERESILKNDANYETQVRSLESDIVLLKQEIEDRQKKWEKDQAATQSQLNTILDQQRNQQNQWARDMEAKNEENLSLNAKIDLLRPEIERRDQRIHQLKDDIRAEQDQKNGLVHQLGDLTNRLREQEEKYSLLSERYGILSQERDAIRSEWAREQAEWRELWDRERELWERKIREKNEFIDNK